MWVDGISKPSSFGLVLNRLYIKDGIGLLALPVEYVMFAFGVLGTDLTIER